MTDMDPAAEQALLAELGRVLNAADANGHDSLERARASFAWHNIDAELAELVADSALDRPDALVRSSDGGTRTLTFSAGVTGIEVEISGDRLIGQVVPGQSATVELIQPTGECIDTSDADEFGVFVIAGLQRGTFSLRLSGADGAWTIRTNWIVI